MRTKFKGILTLLLALVVQLTFAQTKTVTGTVVDGDGLPIPGVNVFIEGTTKGVQTDFDGVYSLQASAGDVLVVTYTGMKTVKKTVGDQTTINFTLQVDLEELSEVVVIGNITQSREKSVISSVKLSEKSIVNRPNPSVVQTLQGQVAGLNIVTNSGQPGGNSTVQIRGVSSVNGDTEPLFIMDGIPVDQDNFRSINPQEIESIEVLKDAAATAIYGNRGANGVIVIKTRRGGFDEKLSINYQGLLSFSSLQENDYNIMNSSQILEYERLRGRGAGAGNSTSVFNPGAGSPMTDEQIANAPNFSWLDYFFRTGLTQNHTMTLSSGSENFSQFTSIGFNETEGILLDSDLKRFNLRNNLSGKSGNGKFSYNTNASINYSNNNEPNEIGGSGINRNFILGAYQSVPYITEGDYTTGGDLLSPLSFTNTPLFLVDRLRTYTRFEEEIRIIAGINMSYQFTDWLSGNITLGGDYQNSVLTRAEGPTSFNALLFGGAENPTSGFQQQQSTRIFNYNQVTSLNASKQFGDHTFGLGLYTEYSKSHFRQFGYFANGLNPSTFFPGDGSGLVPQSGGLFNDEANAQILNAGLFSYFTTFNYDFDSKYGLDFTLRRDSTNRFVGDNKWGTYWSVGGRWNISNEDFMSDSVFNSLKLRASYGEQGNQFITGTLFSGLDLYLDLFASFGGYQNANSLGLSQFANPTLQWETISTLNVGVDFGVFENRLRGAFDVYQRETDDLFLAAPVSATSGITSLNQNVGQIFNRGFDFQIDYDLVRKTKEGELGILIGALGNYNMTEIGRLTAGSDEIITGGSFSAGLGRVGGELYEYRGLRFAGVNPANGELLYYTADGNVTETPDPDADAVWLDKNPLPEFQGSFKFEIEYKNFFLTTLWAYQLGVDRIDTDYSIFVNQDNVGQFNLSTDVLREWRQPGDVTDIPSPSAANRNSFASDRFMRNSDFLRLRFASLGYNFPRKVLEKTGLTNAQIFINGENFITFTEWRGFDPETRNVNFGTGGSTSRGYPTPAIFSVGLNIGF
jgi:TonB-linked SusC/RagA family outer membrane protein